MKKSSPGCLWMLLIFAAFVVASQFLESDLFEKLFYPEKYWNNRVTTLQNKINNLQLQIVEVSREFKNSANTELREMTFEYMQSGLPPDEAAKLAAETLPKIIEVRKQLLDAYIGLLEKSNKELVEAKQKVKEYERR